MNFLEERILKDGIVKEGNVLKVDGFLNHQMDVELMDEIGKEFHRRFADIPVTKILTIEASGIAIAYAVARCFGVPFVFAKKAKSINIDGDMFVEDFEYQAIVGGEFELARDFRYQRKKSEERVGEDIIIKLLDKLIDLQDEKCNLSTKCGCSNSRVVTFDEIASGLIGGLGVEHVLNILPGYLAIINKEMYEGFIAGLIRVCVLEGDTSFMVPLRFLSQIKDGNFIFKADAIYYKIYDAIVYNERVIAFAYLNILNEANNIGISVDLNLISFFKNLLENGNDTLKDEDDFKDQVDVGEHYYGVLGVGS